MKLTQKQIGFTRDYFIDVPPGKAYMTHYKVKSMPVANSCASKLLKKANIQAYLKELRDKADDKSIATVLQRKQVASKVTLATIADFVDEYGNLNITDKSQLNTPAVAELKTERTATGGIRTTLKLRDPLSGADMLNKMDKLYSEAGNVTYNDIKVLIVREKPKEIEDATE